MSLLILAAVAALQMQTQTQTQTQTLALPVELPAVANATPDPGCGGRAAMAAMAVCVAVAPAELEAALRAYEAALAPQGWLVADARGHVTVYLRRKPEGGCDAFQVLAFADDGTRPDARAGLAFATVPSDLCRARPAALGTPAQ